MNRGASWDTIRSSSENKGRREEGEPLEGNKKNMWFQK